MGNGWAVGAASVLGLSVAMASVPGVVAPFRFGGVAHPTDLVRLVLVVIVAGMWAYALVTATQGRRGSVLALLVLTLLYGVALQGALSLQQCLAEACGAIPLALATLNLLVGAAASWALFQEVRRRRGPFHLLHAAGIVLPAVVLAALLLA